VSTSFPIPDGYASSADALKRAEAHWGLGDAAPKLVGLILGGKLPSFLSDAQGKVHKISPEAWQNIDAVRTLREQEFRNFLEFPSKLSRGRPVFIESDLRRELPWDWEEDIGSRQIPSTKKRGGRPAKSSIDEFWIEAARLIHTGEQGDTTQDQTQQQFIEAMQRWVGINEAGYADDTVGDKIKLLWKRLNLSRHEK